MDGKLSRAHFASPSAPAIDPTDSALVFGDGDTVRRMQAGSHGSDGSVNIIAGRATETGFHDANGRQARFSDVLAAVVSSKGDILVADHYNQRVRRLTRNCTATLLAPATSPYAW